MVQADEQLKRGTAGPREPRFSLSGGIPGSGRRGSALGGLLPLLLVALAVILAIRVYPLLQVGYLSLTSRTTMTEGSFVWLENFQTILADDRFTSSLWNAFVLLVSVPLSIVAGLIVAAVVGRKLFASSIVEVASYLPLLPSVPAVAVLFVFLFSPVGPIAEATEGTLLGWMGEPWLAQSHTAIWAVALVMSWKRAALLALIFVARLAALDRNLSEAAAVDGASYLKTFLRIELPQMGSVIAFGAIIGIIEVFSYAFAYVFVLTQGGPGISTTTPELLIYRTQFLTQAIGRASAMSVLLLLIVTVFAVIASRVEREPA